MGRVMDSMDGMDAGVWGVVESDRVKLEKVMVEWS
jgi:hypothetical protein